MLEFARYTVLASTALIGFALLGYVVVLFSSQRRLRPVKASRKLASVGVGSPASTLTPDAEPVASQAIPDQDPRAAKGLGWYASKATQLALVLLTAGLIARTIAVGHAPMSNQYEFAVSFAWGMIAAFVYFEWRYQVRSLALGVLPVVLGILLYADTVGAEAAPLMPALQNHLLLSLHVFTAVLAYGAFAVGFAAAVLYLVKEKANWKFLPGAELLDEIGYRSTVIGFPLLTIMIILGAIWADTAWGSYWSWDPKETAALVTWLVYGAYLHARVVRDWRGTRSAWLLILGFVAVLFTYYGNLFFGGMHSYA